MNTSFADSGLRILFQLGMLDLKPSRRSRIKLLMEQNDGMGLASTALSVEYCHGHYYYTMSLLDLYR